jgi:DNA-binding transcriptional ArsR family regulator
MTTRSDALFAALSDGTRRGLFQRLARDGEFTVKALTEGAGISQPAVSKHLGVLKQAGLVRLRRAGRETFYRAQPRALKPLVDWLQVYGTFWSDRFDQLEKLLDRMDQ